ncbi:DUF2127 domain-containing protein [Luteimonas suaedae]|uniref:DUF2127 domain-containing protein n=1 Tax=Luteimonas suaedae TaxID=2605430 RepID=UPI0011EC52B9|nr:DUF2127 domain-containing protein [Luteimonas suaedae]
MPVSAASASLRTIAMFEWAKGGAALLLASGLLALGPGRLHHVLEHLAARLHIGRTQGPFAWIDRHVDHRDLDIVAMLCGLYAAFRLVEGWGLWRNMDWAIWLGLLSVAAYLPLDVLAAIRHPGISSSALLVFNLAVAAILAVRLEIHRPGT